MINNHLFIRHEEFVPRYKGKCVVYIFCLYRRGAHSGVNSSGHVRGHFLGGWVDFCRKFVKDEILKTPILVLFFVFFVLQHERGTLYFACTGPAPGYIFSLYRGSGQWHSWPSPLVMKHDYRKITSTSPSGCYSSLFVSLQLLFCRLIRKRVRPQM
jgi:hypothetical protein